MKKIKHDKERSPIVFQMDAHDEGPVEEAPVEEVVAPVGDDGTTQQKSFAVDRVMKTPPRSSGLLGILFVLLVVSGGAWVAYQHWLLPISEEEAIEVPADESTVEVSAEDPEEVEAEKPSEDSSEEASEESSDVSDIDDSAPGGIVPQKMSDNAFDLMTPQLAPGAADVNVSAPPVAPPVLVAEEIAEPEPEPGDDEIIPGLKQIVTYYPKTETWKPSSGVGVRIPKPLKPAVINARHPLEKERLAIKRKPGMGADFATMTPQAVYDRDMAVLKKGRHLTQNTTMTSDMQLRLVRAFALRTISPDTVVTTLDTPNGVAFANRFFNDKAWLEDFCASGPMWSPARSYQTLVKLAAADTLNSMFDTVGGRRMATALALNAQKESDEAIKEYYLLFVDLLNRGRLNACADTQCVADWRFVVDMPRAPARDLRFLNALYNMPRDMQGEATWMVSYRLANFFGDSIHGPMYYKPWAHVYSWMEGAYRIGGVCGALSYFGQAGAKAHGCPSCPGGQPGHCAVSFLFRDGRWRINNYVSPPTGAHFGFWGSKFSGLELAQAVYNAPKLLVAERLFWKASLAQPEGTRGNTGKVHPDQEYNKLINAMYLMAAQALPIHYGIWEAYGAWLTAAREGAPRESWTQWGIGIARGMTDYQEPSWELINRYYLGPVRKASPGVPVLAALQPIQGYLKQSTRPTPEPFDFSNVLSSNYEMLDKDGALSLRLFKRVIEVQYGTSDFFGKTLAWGASIFLKDSERSEDFINYVVHIFKNHAGTSNRDAMGSVNRELAVIMNKAVERKQREEFQGIGKLYDLLNKKTAKIVYPERKFGGVLVSADGLLLATKKNSMAFAHRLLNSSAAPAEAVKVDMKEMPYVGVALVKPVQVCGLYIEATGGTNDVPFSVSVSPAGDSWFDVAVEGTGTGPWEYKLPDLGFTIDKVRVSCDPAWNKEGFKLKKLLVYAKVEKETHTTATPRATR